MADVSTLLRKMKLLFETENLRSPISIEVDERTAKLLNTEAQMLLRYSTQESFAHNEMMIFGIHIVAPKNFVFSREKPSKDEWLQSEEKALKDSIKDNGEKAG